MKRNTRLNRLKGWLDSSSTTCICLNLTAKINNCIASFTFSFRVWYHHKNLNENDDFKIRTAVRGKLSFIWRRVHSWKRMIATTDNWNNIRSNVASFAQLRLNYCPSKEFIFCIEKISHSLLRIDKRWEAFLQTCIPLNTCFAKSRI